jgi:tRNA1Val (adenine37-N6)-methyltransferase
MNRLEKLGPYELLQPEGGFRLGEDTLRLAAFATLKRGWRVCDLGCGAGPILLLLLGREPALTITGVELEEKVAALARENLARNGLEGKVFTGDLRDPALLPSGQFDLVISNPPWFPIGAGRSGGLARAEEQCTLEELCAAASRLVRNGGRFALVHRPERLVDLCCLMRAYGLEPKRLELVRYSPAHPPSALLVEGVRQGRPGLSVL